VQMSENCEKSSPRNKAIVEHNVISLTFPGNALVCLLPSQRDVLLLLHLLTFSNIQLALCLSTSRTS